MSKEIGPLGVKVTIIEPGGFRTDFAGSSTKLSEGRSEYDSTVGASVRFQRTYNGKQPGNPARAAAVFLGREVLARYVHGNRLPAAKAPTFIPEEFLNSNYLRFRISPDVAIAIGMTVLAPGDKLAGQSTEMIASRQPNAEEMDAYERVLGDAMTGDATLFAREDYVEEAWRIVDPPLQKVTAGYAYEPGSWGPNEIERVAPPGGWQNPVLAHETSAVSGQAA